MGTTYQFGVRTALTQRAKRTRLSAPSLPSTIGTPTTLRLEKGFLSLDAPAAVAWTGLLARSGDRVKFRNGVTLRAVSIQNPPGIFDPVRDDEKYLAFAFYSHDGQPLEKTRVASLCLVSTSFDTGFSMDLSDARRRSSSHRHCPSNLNRNSNGYSSKAMIKRYPPRFP